MRAWLGVLGLSAGCSGAAATPGTVDDAPVTVVELPRAAPAPTLQVEPPEAEREPRPVPHAEQARRSRLEPFGVPECDAYLETMKRCMPNMAPPMQQAMMSALDSVREALVHNEATPAERDQLADVCKSMADVLSAASICP